MKRTHTIAAHILILAFPICTSKGLPASSADPQKLYLESVGKSPEEVIHRYEQQAPKTNSDLFALALAYYAKADFERALDLANQALALQSESLPRSVCFYVIAESHGALGHYNLAAEAALQGSRLNCGNNEFDKKLATLRLVYAREAGDELGARAAKNHLMQLDPTFDREPTVDPLTAILIVYAATYTVYCLTKTIIAAISQNPEARTRIAESLQPPLSAAKVAGLLHAFQ